VCNQTFHWKDAMHSTSFTRRAAGLCALALSLRLGAETLTWDQARAEALQANPALSASQHSRQAADAALSVSDASFWPQLSLNGGLSRRGSQGLSSDDSGSRVVGTPLGLGYGQGQEADSSSYSLGLAATYTLFDGFGDFYARQQSAHSLEGKQAAYRQASYGLRSSLRQAFNQVLYDQQNIKMLNEIMTLLVQETRYLNLEYQSGQQPRWAYLQAKSDEEQTRWQLNQAMLSQASDRRNLADLLGRTEDSGDSLAVSGELKPPAPPSDFSLDLERLNGHPDLLAQQAAADAAESAYMASVASRYPTLSANAGYTYSGGTSTTAGVGAWPPNQSLWTVGLTASYNLFAGGGQEAAISQAEQAWKSQQDTLRDEKASLRTALQQAWTSYRSAFDRMPVQDLAMQVGQQRFETVNRLFEAGQAQYLDFEQAETNLIQSQENQLSAVLSAAQASVAYQKALGLGFEDEGGKQ
jgi:outer membrane protein TolC